MRGLKLHFEGLWGTSAVVAPYTGAWIEIANVELASLWIVVAPYTGAWIEIEHL